jgi:hypothetical protein
MWLVVVVFFLFLQLAIGQVHHHSPLLHLLMVLVIIILVFSLLQPTIAYHHPPNLTILWSYHHGCHGLFIVPD